MMLLLLGEGSVVWCSDTLQCLALCACRDALGIREVCCCAIMQQPRRSCCGLRALMAWQLGVVALKLAVLDYSSDFAPRLQRFGVSFAPTRAAGLWL